MSVRLRYVAAAVTLLLAAAAVFAVAVVPALNTGTVGERLLACSSPDEYESDDEVANIAREDCFSEVLQDAVATGKVREIVPVMALFEAKQMGLCHRASHRAGGELWPEDGRWILEISQLNTPVCSSGLLHGFVDQIVGKEFGEQEWRQLIGWCDAQFLAQVGIACGDAVGHVAWTETADELASRQICAMFATPMWRAECAEGVVMQQYSPASSSKTQTRLPSDPRKVCVIHPAGGKYDPVRAGCIRGVGYATVQQERLIASTPNLVERVDELIGVCGLFEAQYQESCVDRAYDMVRSKFRDNEYFQAAELLCEPGDQYYQTCIDRMLQFVPVEKLGKYAQVVTPADVFGRAFQDQFNRE